MLSNTAQAIRDLLDRLVRAERQENDIREEVHDRVAKEARELPRRGFLPALQAAIGRSRKRRETAVFLVSELLDTPEILDHVREWLHDPDPTWRNWLLQTIAEQRYVQFAPDLTSLIDFEADPECRNHAIRAAGIFKDPTNLPALLRLAAHPPDEHIGALTRALKDYATPACRPFLELVFHREDYPVSLRVVAAWGLAKLEDPSARAFLEQMLYDSDLHTANSFRPGDSFGAAQALSDIYGWTFVRNTRYVELTRQRLAARKAT